MKITILIPFLLYTASLLAQNPEIEAEIRKLEEAERRASIKRDTAVLQKIRDKYFVVNAPFNRVVMAGNPDAKYIMIEPIYYSLTREIEEIVIRDEVVFCMGNEIVVPAGEDTEQSEGIKRRYTNIWMKQNAVWKLVARHVNDICAVKK